MMKYKEFIEKSKEEIIKHYTKLVCKKCEIKSYNIINEYYENTNDINKGIFIVKEYMVSNIFAVYITKYNAHANNFTINIMEI